MLDSLKAHRLNTIQNNWDKIGKKCGNCLTLDNYSQRFHFNSYIILQIHPMTVAPLFLFLFPWNP